MSVKPAKGRIEEETSVVPHGFVIHCSSAPNFACMRALHLLHRLGVWSFLARELYSSYSGLGCILFLDASSTPAAQVWVMVLSSA